MLRIDAQTGAIISHTPAPRKRMFEDLETAAKAMREQDDRKESIFRQSIEAEKNKEDLFEKKFAEALRKAKDAPAGSFDMLCTLLGALPRLQTLDLRECALPPRSDFQHLGALQSLRIIERSTPMVFYRVQVYLEKLPALVKVCVFVCPAIHSDGPAYRISNSRRVD